MSEQVFRQNPVRAVLGALALALLLDVIALVIIPQLLPDTIYTSGRFTIVFSAIAVITVVVLIGMLWLRNLQVRVTPETVVIGRPGKWETYPRATTVFRTHITEHRTNGVRSGTTRALLVHTGAGERTVPLPGFSRTVFNELVATLNPITLPQVADPVEAARLRSGLPVVFAVDASRERSSGIRFLVVAAVALVVTAITLTPLLDPAGLDGDSIIILLAPIAGIVTVGFGIGGFQRLRVAGKAQTQVTIGAAGIRIGEVEHAYAQLTRIWLTPPAYGTKRLTLESGAVRSVQVLESARIRITPEYAAFAASLQAHAAGRPGLLSLDRE